MGEAACCAQPSWARGGQRAALSMPCPSGLCIAFRAAVAVGHRPQIHRLAVAPAALFIKREHAQRLAGPTPAFMRLLCAVVRMRCAGASVAPRACCGRARGAATHARGHAREQNATWGKPHTPHRPRRLSRGRNESLKEGKPGGRRRARAVHRPEGPLMSFEHAHGLLLRASLTL